MGFRAMLFSKSIEANAAMTTACAGTDIRIKPVPDIFNAIEQVKKSKYSCIIVDWAEQPEANFLLKRARESDPNRDTVSIVIVDHEPTPAEMHDNHLDFLIYRPVSQNEACEVLAKAREKMRHSDEKDEADDLAAAEANQRSESSETQTPYSSQQSSAGELASSYASADTENVPTGSHQGEEARSERRSSVPLLAVCVVALALATGIFLYGPRDAVGTVVHAARHVFVTIQESAASVLFKPKLPGATPAPASTDNHSDPKVSDSSATTPTGPLGVVATTSTLLDAPAPLAKAFDFPLPEPIFERPVIAPVKVVRAAIPDSMKSSPPIAPPVVVTVNPAQMMPVSHPLLQPAVQQASEPVSISEEAERALLVRSVDPIYPAAGAAQKLHGPVVLQALIGRDGSVEDIKIIRGYFILGKAASAAVKQWRFQPYIVNGRAVSTQTTITINFTYPPA